MAWPAGQRGNDFQHFADLSDCTNLRQTNSTAQSTEDGAYFLYFRLYHFKPLHAAAVGQLIFCQCPHGWSRPWAGPLGRIWHHSQHQQFC